MRIYDHDKHVAVDSAKFKMMMDGLDMWLRNHMVLPNILYGVKNGITEQLATDEMMDLTFIDGGVLEVNKIEEVMVHELAEIVEIRTYSKRINIDDYSLITDQIPDNVLSLVLMGTLLMYNTLDNSIDRAIYFRGNGYTQEIYPMMLEEVGSLDELLGITLVDIVNRYSRGTSRETDEAINRNLKNHSNYNMLRYYVQSIMHEIRLVQPGVDTPDTMWELMIKEGELHIVYMGNPHMYRLLASKLNLGFEEDVGDEYSQTVFGLPYV